MFTHRMNIKQRLVVIAGGMVLSYAAVSYVFWRLVNLWKGK